MPSHPLPASQCIGTDGRSTDRLKANRFIIDVLNDSVADVLPEDGWRKLNQYLCHLEGEAHKEVK